MKNPSLSELRQLSERERKRWPRWIIIPVALVAGAVLWTIVGFFVAPSLVRAQVRGGLASAFGREVVIERVRINPFLLTVRIEGVAVSAAQGGPAVLAWKSLDLDVHARSLFARGWHFRAVDLDGVTATVTVGKDGRVDFPLAASGQKFSAKLSGKARPLGIDRLSITGARLAYRDLSLAQPFATDVGPTNLQLSNFRTGDQDQAPGEFRAVTESGETVVWTGVISVGPLKSEGELRLGNISLWKYAPFYRDRVRFDVLDGRLDFGGRYQFALRDGRPFLQVTNGYLSLRELKLAPRGARDSVLSLKSIDASGITADSAPQSAAVARLAITGGNVKARRDSEGIDLLRLLALEEAVTASGATGPQPRPSLPNIGVAEVSVRELDFEFEDLQAQPGLRQVATGISADIRNIVLREPATELPVGLRAGLGDQSFVSAVGRLALVPFRADVSLELSAYPVARLNPYLGEWLDLQAAAGFATVLGNLRLFPDDSGSLAFGFAGDVVVEQFSSASAEGGEALAHWQNLTLRGLELGNSPKRLTLADGEWLEPAFHIVVAEDGTLNLPAQLHAATMRAQPLSGNARRSGVESDDPWYVSVDRLTLEGGSVEYIDKSIQPHVRTVAGQLKGSLEGLSSSPLSRATLDLRGKIDGTSPLVVTGKLNPLTRPAFAEVRTSARYVELAPFGPYLSRYGGYQFAKGTLTLESRMKLAQGKLDSANTVTLDQFTLGKKVSSPEATGLPVALAISLLRDRSGRIVFEVPVRGNVGDPAVSLTRAVKGVITSALNEAASAPFSTLLASVGGGAGEELGTLRFAAGKAEMTAEVKEQLDLLSKGLRERTLVSVDVQGFWDAAADTPMLRERALETELRQLIWADRKMVEPDMTFEEVQLAPEQKMGMVRRFYYKTFPDEIPLKPLVQRQESQESSRPVTGARGNLGSFERREPTVRRPPADAQSRPGAGIQFQGMSSPLMPGGAAAGGGATGTPPGLPYLSAAPVAEGTAPLSLSEMKERLLARITVGQDALRALAEARARSVRDYLVSTGEIAPERVTVLPSAVSGSSRAGPRVRLNLK